MSSAGRERVRLHRVIAALALLATVVSSGAVWGEQLLDADINQPCAADLALGGDWARDRSGDPPTYRLLDEGADFHAILAAITLRLPAEDRAPRPGDDSFGVCAPAASGKALGPTPLLLHGEAWVVGAKPEARMAAGPVESRPASVWWPLVETLIARNGTIYAISERLRVDTAVGFEVIRGNRDVLVTLGFTWSF